MTISEIRYNYPTNFVVTAGKLWYIDYECNACDPQWDFETWGRQYRGME